MAAGLFRSANDPVAIVRAMIASADGAEAPLRLPLGADTYRSAAAATGISSASGNRRVT
jgi:hypothetical protein